MWLVWPVWLVRLVWWCGWCGGMAGGVGVHAVVDVGYCSINCIKPVEKLEMNKQKRSTRLNTNEMNT